jgi:hypothetical protein
LHVRAGARAVIVPREDLIVPREGRERSSAIMRRF